MATGGGQISSLHLAVAAGGGVLLYAALRGVSPLAALKDITSGHPPQVSTEGKVITGANGQMDPSYTPGAFGTSDWHGVYKLSKTPKALQKPATLIAALNGHASETYSQDARWSKGHSDCASFLGKGLLDIGIAPPGTSVTTDYLGSGSWVKVSSPRAGDIAVNSEHVAIFTDGANGIGQQNSRRNVQRDVMDNLMANTGSWEIRRWKGWA